MNSVIIDKLLSIEADEKVKILYACESGSRAWGFASPDSDYDVRFIYARPVGEYLSIKERRDVIEVPVNEVLDISGWDIRKALQLMLKSNAPLYEWLQSPIVYMESGGLKEEMVRLAATYFSNRAGCHHYLSMARNTFENELQTEMVKIKKYFYALRPLLSALWIIERGSMPPMTFEQLRTLVREEEWNTVIDDLLEKKKMADEKGMIEPVLLLQEWIQSTLAYCQEKTIHMSALKNDTQELDILFRKYIGK
jgi:predicted nucleotidyltransferase